MATRYIVNGTYNGNAVRWTFGFEANAIRIAKEIGGTVTEE